MSRANQQLEIIHYSNPFSDTDGQDNLNPDHRVDRRSIKYRSKDFIRRNGLGRGIRKKNRFSHTSIVRIEDGSSHYPFFALMYNTSKTGIYFESLYGLACGIRINVTIENPPFNSAPKSCMARVVWCRALVEKSDFLYGVGLEYC